MRCLHLSLLGLVLLSPGCTLSRLLRYNVINEIGMACDNNELRHDLRALAREAWRTYELHHATQRFTDEFADGFQDGYADYLERGGSGAPPAIAPKKYRRNEYRTAEGNILVQQYFLGFSIGARLAKESGIRPHLLIQVSTSLPSSEATQPVSRDHMPSRPDKATLPEPKPTPKTIREVLPTPPVKGPQLLPDVPKKQPILPEGESPRLLPTAPSEPDGSEMPFEAVFPQVDGSRAEDGTERPELPS